MDASVGLSMIMNRHAFDCLLIDADMLDIDLKAFLQEVLKCHSRLSIIMMASGDILMRIAKKTLENEAVMCLLKPCRHSDICNIWEHICRKSIPFQENTSKGMLPHIEDQVKLSEIVKGTSFNNNIEGNFAEALAVNSKEYGTKFKQVTYEDLFPDPEVHDEIIAKENVGTVTKGKSDKEKQPLVLKRKNDQHVEDDQCCEKKKGQKLVRWKDTVLHDRFKEALNTLGEQAQAKAIRKHMNVEGLTRIQVASHLQKYKLKKTAVKPSRKASAQMGNNVQVENYDHNRYWYSTRSDKDAFIQSSSLQRSSYLNSVGVSYMSIDNIKAKLLGAPPLSSSQPTTTSNNNFGGYQATNHGFGLLENFNSSGQENEIQMRSQDYGNEIVMSHVTPKISTIHDFQEAMAPSADGSATTALNYSLEINAAKFPNAFTNCSSGGAGVRSESQELLNSLGLAKDPWVAAGGGAAASVSMAPFADGATTMTSSYSLGMDATNFSNDFHNSNSGGTGGGFLSEAQEPLDLHGSATQPWAPAAGGTAALISMASSINGATTMASDYSSGTNVTNFSFGFDNSTSGGASCGVLSEAKEPLDLVGLATEPWVAASGCTSALISMASSINGAATVASDYSLGTNVSNCSSGLDHCTSGIAIGSVLGKAKELSDLLGLATEPWVDAPGGTSALISMATSINGAATMASDYSLKTNVANCSSGFDNCTSGGTRGSVLGETKEPLDLLGLPAEPWVSAAHAGVTAASISTARADVAATMTSGNSLGMNAANFSNDFNNCTSGGASDSVLIEAQKQLDIQELATEPWVASSGGNSIIPMVGPESTEEDLFPIMCQTDLGMTMDNLFDDDGHIISGIF